jgi:signal transduction histidine kinase/ActR/RegA family two-component response regulator
MEAKQEVTQLQKQLILTLMAVNAIVPFCKLLIIFLEIALSKDVSTADLVFHILAVPLHACVAVAYSRGFIPIKVLGVLCSELACLAFLIIGNFVEPHLNSIWSLGGLYLTFFVQANLIDNPKLKFLCYLKPLSTTVVFGIASGQLYLKEVNDLIVIVVNLLFGIIGAHSFVASEDIKQRLMQELREAKQQLTAIISAVPAGILVLTAQDVLVMTNETSFNLLGCTEAQELQDKLSALQFRPGSIRYQESSHTLMEDLRCYLSSASSDLANFGQTEEANKFLNWLAKKTTWKSEPAIVVSIRDITDVIRLERTQMESQFKNVMLRSVSHELRTPTNGILHSVQAVLRGDDVPLWARDKLDLAEVSCKHLLLLIDDLLDYSQIVAGRFSLSLSHFEVRRVLSDCVELMRLVAQRKKIRLVKHFDPLLPELCYSDSNRLSQVLLNLLSNAVKFTPRKGYIEVIARLTDQRQMQISVTDNGVGIAPENFARLFQCFGRLESSASINPQGVGLGLHISNMLALQLGGAPIDVKSRLREGSCFSFNVKIAEVEQDAFSFYDTDWSGTEESGVARAIYAIKVTSKKNPPVLIVDDSPFNRSVIADILAANSIPSTEADNGQEAFDYVIRRAQAQLPVTVVVMDFEMPEMNGPTTCRRILARLNELGLPAPKIIAHTAYSAEEDLRQCIEAGMVDLLPKPASYDQILLVIRRYLG